MEKAKRKKYHAVIACILIVMVILTGCSKISQQPTDSQPIVESASETESILVSDAPPTTEAQEETQPMLAAPNAKPENILDVEQPEDRITYLRSLLMELLCVPDQLGDSCYIKLGSTLVQVLSTEKIEGGTIHEYEALTTAYYVKDNDVVYRNKMSMQTWNEVLNDRQEIKYLYNPYGSWVRFELFEDEKTLKEIYEKKNSSFPTISGTLSQEVYSAGQEYVANMALKQHMWNNKMLTVGLWYTKLTGECYGEIAGDIYVVEPNETKSSGRYWICFDGMEPIKIPRIEGTTFHLTEAPPAVEGADFAKEKERALFRLSFDLLVEPPEEIE